jgi:hypothetical protein
MGAPWLLLLEGKARSRRLFQKSRVTLFRIMLYWHSALIT